MLWLAEEFRPIYGLENTAWLDLPEGCKDLLSGDVFREHWAGAITDSGQDDGVAEALYPGDRHEAFRLQFQVDRGVENRAWDNLEYGLQEYLDDYESLDPTLLTLWETGEHAARAYYPGKSPR